MKLTEKQKNCPYCRYDKETTQDYYKVRPDTAKDKMTFGELILPSDRAIGFDGQRYFFCSFGNIYGCPIEYCPMCGRPLNEEEE